MLCVCSLFSTNSCWISQGNFFLWHYGKLRYSQLDTPSHPRGELPDLLCPCHRRWITVRRDGEEDGKRESRKSLLCWYPSLSASPRWSYTGHLFFLQTADQECGCAYMVPVANLCLSMVSHIPRTRFVRELRARCWNGCTPNRATFTKISVPTEPPKQGFISKLSHYFVGILWAKHIWKEDPWQ